MRRGRTLHVSRLISFAVFNVFMPYLKGMRHEWVAPKTANYRAIQSETAASGRANIWEEPLLEQDAPTFGGTFLCLLDDYNGAACVIEVRSVADQACHGTEEVGQELFAHGSFVFQ